MCLSTLIVERVRGSNKRQHGGRAISLCGARPQFVCLFGCLCHGVSVCVCVLFPSPPFSFGSFFFLCFCSSVDLAPLALTHDPPEGWGRGLFLLTRPAGLAVRAHFFSFLSSLPTHNVPHSSFLACAPIPIPSPSHPHPLTWL